MPLLTALSLEGYRAIPPGKPVTLKLRPLTLILGPNSVSKSSVLEAASKAFSLEPLGTVEDTYKGLGGTVRLEAQLSLAAAEAEQLRRLARAAAPEAAEKAAKELARQRGLEPYAEKLAICLMERYASSLVAAEAGGTANLVVKTVYSVHGSRLELVEARLHRPGAGDLELLKENIGNCLDMLGLEIRDSGSAAKSILGTRLSLPGKRLAIDSRTVDAILLALHKVGTSFLHKRLLSGLLGARTRFIGSDRLPKPGVLDARMGLGRLLYTSYPDPEVASRLLRWLGLAGRYTRLRVVPDTVGGAPVIRVEVYDGFVGEWVALERAAGGLRFVLPVLAALASAEPGSIVLIDDLELGLHPAAQACLVEAVVETVKRGVQVVAVTHSSMVLLRTLYAVYSGELDEKDVLINVMYRDEERVYAEPLEPRIPLKLSPRAEEALRRMGAVEVLGEEGRLAMELARLVAEKLGGEES